MSIVTRFAPSPTGLLHVGNVRTALISWLFARHNNGKFILRIDDTDLERSKPEFEDAIKKDLLWLGINWDILAHQSHRLDVYKERKDQLIKSGRLYPCYESKEELQIKRKIQLSRGQPPVYDRAALKLTDEQRTEHEAAGRMPHYRFKLNQTRVVWDDMIHGYIEVDASSMSDPILIREDGSWTYMLCSVVDDIDFNISHVIRGDDHISNTAIHIQMFEAFGKKEAVFGHLSRVTTKDAEISKRTGGFDIQNLREEKGLEAATISNFLASSGTTTGVVSDYVNNKDLISNFDIKTFTKSPIHYEEEDVVRLNHRILAQYSFDKVEARCKAMGLDTVTQPFWQAVHDNLRVFSDIKYWYDVCFADIESVIHSDDKMFLKDAASCLPGQIAEGTWAEWIAKIKEVTGRGGKKLFMPLRLALTGVDNGPEVKLLLPFMTREKIVSRLLDNKG